MREEVKRILVMVQEGKISAQDAAELIEAFEAGEPAPEHKEREEAGVGAAGQPGFGGGSNGASQGAGSNGTAGKDPFRAFVETMEKFGREASQSLDWPEMSRIVRSSANEGIEALRTQIAAVSKGQGFHWFNAVESREVTLPLSIPTDRILKIENFCGDIKVVGGFDIGSVTARATFKGATPEETKKRAAEYTLLVEESDYGVLVRQADLPNVSVDLEIQLSSSASLEIRCESGDVSVLDTHAACRVASRSGDVKLRGLNGPIDVSLTSGQISVEDSTAPQVTIVNKSGDLILKRVQGSVSATTTSGNVKLSESIGSAVSVETVSGNVNASLLGPVSGTVNIRTVSGNAALVVPDDCDCRVSLSTLRGQVACELPLGDTAQDEHRLTGRLGNGTGSLAVSAVSGNVELRMARVQVQG